MMKSLLVAVLVACGLSACAGRAVRQQTTATVDLIAEARDNGALKCAPVELAMAESYNDYAIHALDEGNYYRGKRSAAIAEKNARLAIEKSPKDKCTERKLPPRPGDRDGDGLNDDVDKCPDDPEDKDGFEDEDGCPDLDNDADGIKDTSDKCPLDPEDPDKFEDEDGCPDLDNDADSFLDKDDKCPLEFGVAPDGCPKKYTNVVVTKTKIEIKQTIFFEFNKARIKRVSFGLLNEVAQAMKDNPTIKVEIQGHTDSVGRDRSNMRLSQKRAESVRTYLIKQGIDAKRMVPKGYGETVPIADNRTSDGRAQNRRVEFVITER